jgi:uncharacterized protein DUF4276
VIYIAPIVEGHGEVEAVPALLHRIFNAIGYRGQVLLNPPIRVKVGSFLADPDYRRKMILLASAKAVERSGTVMMLFDCEDKCPAELGPKLLTDARAVRADVQMLVVLSYREYETWFITAARSLRGRRGLPMDLEPPANPEAIRGAKEWLGERMATSYDPIIHQAEFSRTIDIEQARGNPSFNRLCNRLSELVPPPVA